MDSTDALLLARIQFGFTISFHIIFPALTIGLRAISPCWKPLAETRARYISTSPLLDEGFLPSPSAWAWSRAGHGLPVRHQLERVLRFAGGVTGPLLAYEVLTAFFLEAGFLGVMLFGCKRVGPGLHFFAR